MKKIFPAVFVIGLLTAPGSVHASTLDGKAIYCLEKTLTSPEALGFEFLADEVRAHKIIGYSVINEYSTKYSEIGTTQIFWRGLQNTRVSLNRATLELKIAQAKLYKCQVSSEQNIKLKLQTIIDAAKKKNKI